MSLSAVLRGRAQPVRSDSLCFPTESYSIGAFGLNSQGYFSYEFGRTPYFIQPAASLGYTSFHTQGNNLQVASYSSLSRLLPLEGRFFTDISSLFNVDPVSYVPVHRDPQLIDEVATASMRDESLMRILTLHRAFYDLSPIVFCKTVCLVDAFMARLKVRPKYMMCVATSCYYIASKFDEETLFRPTVDSLVRLVRCIGSTFDVAKMINIIISKLEPSTVTDIGATSASVLDFLSAFLSDAQRSLTYKDLPTFLVRQAENALCASSSARYRPSCIALALLLSYKQNSPLLCVNDTESSAFKPLESLHADYLFELADFCGVRRTDVNMCCRALIENGALESRSPSKSMIFDRKTMAHFSRRSRKNIFGCTQPSLNTISEWTEDEEKEQEEE